MAAAGFVARAAERGREDEPAAATLAALTSALAELYARSGRLDTSLQLWLALRSRRILAFVREHSMVGGVRHHAKLLVQLDRAAAIELLAAHHATVEPASVVRQLSAEPRAVHEYLHALFLRDARAGAAFHSQQVELYARFAPAELRLFLAQSSECSLEAALATCEAHGLQREVVYILSRMGAQRAALDRILSELDDVPYALAFVREQADAELTDALLAHALHSASRAAELLRHLSGARCAARARGGMLAPPPRRCRRAPPPALARASLPAPRARARSRRRRRGRRSGPHAAGVAAAATAAARHGGPRLARRDPAHPARLLAASGAGLHGITRGGRRRVRARGRALARTAPGHRHRRGRAAGGAACGSRPAPIRLPCGLGVSVGISREHGSDECCDC